MSRTESDRPGWHPRTAANKAPIRHSRSGRVRSEALVATRVLGICEQIGAALGLGDAGRRPLKAVLARHTHRTAYHQAAIAGRRRINLDGTDAGAIEARHIEHAQEELAHKAVARLPPIPRPEPCPAPQAPLLVARNRPTVIARKRWRIAREGP